MKASQRRTRRCEGSCNYLEFSKIIRGGQSQPEDMLLTVFGFASENREVRRQSHRYGIGRAWCALEDPEAELAAMRPHLAEWWGRNVDEPRDLGVR